MTTTPVPLDERALLREIAAQVKHEHDQNGGCSACDIDALLEDLKEVEE